MSRSLPRHHRNHHFQTDARDRARRRLTKARTMCSWSKAPTESASTSPSNDEHHDDFFGHYEPTAALNTLHKPPTEPDTGDEPDRPTVTAREGRVEPPLPDRTSENTTTADASVTEEEADQTHRRLSQRGNETPPLPFPRGTTAKQTGARCISELKLSAPVYKHSLLERRRHQMFPRTQAYCFSCFLTNSLSNAKSSSSSRHPLSGQIPTPCYPPPTPSLLSLGLFYRRRSKFPRNISLVDSNSFR